MQTKINFKNFSAKVASKRELIPNVILLSILPQEKVEYKAGQYFSFRLQNNINRSYSTLSAPHEENIEFLIDTTPGGPGSKFVENVDIGDEFNLMGPLGFFNLDDTKVSEANSLIFIATGSGIVPIRSMLVDSLVARNIDKPIKLYFGLRHDTAAYLFEEFFELEATYPNFRFIPVISRPSEAWTGAVGYCQDVVKESEVEKGANIYVCGRTETVKSISESLIEYGYDKERIFFEKFG